MLNQRDRVLHVAMVCTLLATLFMACNDPAAPSAPAEPSPSEPTTPAGDAPSSKKGSHNGMGAALDSASQALGLSLESSVKESAQRANATQPQAHLQAALADPSTWGKTGARLNWLDLLETLYEAQDFKPVFTQADGLSERGLVIMQILDDSEQHALLPQHLHLEALRSRLDLIESIDPDDPPKVQAERARALAKVERILADAALTYAHDMRLGNLNDLDLEDRMLQGDDHIIAERLTRFFTSLSNDDLDVVFTKLIPPWPQYAKLQRALPHYRNIVAHGGWKTLEIPKRRLPLKIGARGDRVTALQRRLAIEGYFDGDIDGRFGKELRDALKVYQFAHQLDEDGTIDEDDLTSLNAPAEVRLAQIEVTMDRWRRSRIGDDNYYVWINIPDFHGEVWRDGDRLRRFRVIVGNRGHFLPKALDRPIYKNATPLFSDEMEQIIFNPYWNVPQRIRIREIEPKLEKNPNYYEEKGFIVMEKGRGVQLRQLPGPLNALGKVKFIFPNQYNVYMHDTPDRHLFRHEMRAFSHGCMRVHEPLELAKLLLEQDGNSASRARQSVNRHKAGERTSSYELSAPLPVHIEYYVVRVHDDGRVHFGADIYRYDRPLVAARLEAKGYASEQLLAYNKKD